jgi:hypothetical protein
LQYIINKHYRRYSTAAHDRSLTIHERRFFLFSFFGELHTTHNEAVDDKTLNHKKKKNTFSQTFIFATLLQFISD